MSIINSHLSRGAAIQTPNRAIIHAMAEYLYHEGKWRHASEFLEMIGLSAHILISPNGDIYKCREDTQGAYHARGNNNDTLGAEWLVDGRHDYESFLATIKDPYLTDIQFNNGCEYIRENWVRELGILRYERHSDVSPERKVDPGEGFHWIKFLQNIGVIYR